jgi:hypothetical protein
MTLMPDDDPELAMSPAVIPPDVDFLPALIGGEGPVSPARAYLLSLNSPAAGRPWPRSSALSPVMLGAASLDACSWGSLRRHHVMAVTELLRDTGRATATVNTYLSALKGVAKEAWMLRLMDVESFQHIRAVRNLRGSRLPAAGPCRRRRSVRCLIPARPMTPASGYAMRRCWPSFSAAACAGRRPWGWFE